MAMTNRVLESLSIADAAALRPHLQSMHLQAKQVVHQTGSPITHVYFPTGAVISLVVDLAEGSSVEAAMVGYDGVAGASAALGAMNAINRGVVQLSGSSLVCEAAVLRSIAWQSVRMLSTIIRHDQALFAQAQQSAACMSSHTVEARLGRWLLRASDLSASDTLEFTQEFLAEMLGAQRTSVTLAAQALQDAGLIDYRRGRIRILNPPGLREMVCECYETVKNQYSGLAFAEHE